MVLGAVWCPLERTREISVRIREIKQKHKLPAHFEIKWSKVSPGQLGFYSDVIDYFFDNADLHFRGYVVHKKGLDHKRFDQDHDAWYYKIYFQTLSIILKPKNRYRFYFDLKDTRSGEKLTKLREVMSNSIYDFRREVVQSVQAVHSKEVAQVQLADLLIGCVGFANRQHENPSPAKLHLVDRVKARSGYSLLRPTLIKEEKFNIFHWRGQSE
jgi:sensor histidine kinase YesM